MWFKTLEQWRSGGLTDKETEIELLAAIAAELMEIRIAMERVGDRV